MTTPVIRRFNSMDELSFAAADLFVESSGTAIQQKGSFDVALSGGSTPGALYALLATTDYSSRVLWEQIRFFWGDERFVPHTHPDSNYKMAYEALLSKVPCPASNIFPVPTDALSPQHAATQYEATLRQHLVRFDFILLGLGEDGHTASLFPYSNALHEKNRWVVANYVDKLQSHRITLTFDAINRADRVVFLISGKRKTNVLEEILNGPRDPERLPAQLVQPVTGTLIFLISL